MGSMYCEDPLDSISVDAEEIVFSSKRQESIHPNFVCFTNLNSLFLNENKIQRIENLVPDPEDPATVPVAFKTKKKGCFRLKQLNLSNNRLTTLRGDLQNMYHLDKLHLSHNQLRDLEFTISCITHLKLLRMLDLFGNPVAEESNYRLYIIFHIPSLEVLDRHHIGLDERAEANRLFGKSVAAQRTAFGKTMHSFAPVDPVGEISPCEELLITKVEGYHRKADAEERRRIEREAAELEREEEAKRNAMPPANREVLERPRASFSQARDAARKVQVSVRDLFDQDEETLVLSIMQGEALSNADTCEEALRSALERLRLVKPESPIPLREIQEFVSNLFKSARDRMSFSASSSASASLGATRVRMQDVTVESQELLDGFCKWTLFCQIKADSLVSKAQDIIKYNESPKLAHELSQRANKLLAFVEQMTAPSEDKASALLSPSKAIGGNVLNVYRYERKPQAVKDCGIEEAQSLKSSLKFDASSYQQFAQTQTLKSAGFKLSAKALKL